MKTYECTECGQEIESPVPPKKPCKCGARGKWKEVQKSQYRGTPKDLKGAITNGLLVIQPQKPLEVGVDVLRVHIKDFLSQKFTAAMHKAESAMEVEDLHALFEECTK